MKHIYYTCDKCKEKLPQEQRLILPIGDLYNGVETEVEYKEMHLCFNCLSKGIEKYFSDETREIVKCFVKNYLGFTC